jgi:hypothetical protein
VCLPSSFSCSYLGRRVGRVHLISSHFRLATITHNLLKVSLGPTVATSLCNILIKHSIVDRLSSFMFYRHLENLCPAAFAVLAEVVTFKILGDLICYVHALHTYLVEECTLAAFAGNWLECLGDLAWYGMAVATMAGAVSQLGAGAGAGLSESNLVAISRAAHDLASRNPSQQKEMGDGADDDGNIRSLSDESAGRGSRGSRAR